MNADPAREPDALAPLLDQAVHDFRRRNPESARQFEAAAKYMPGGNTRSVLFYEPFPLVMARGEDCRLTDVDGHGYIDLLGEYTAGIYGHSHPVILDAIGDALRGGLNLAAHNTYEGRLARVLCERFRLQSVRFTNSGSEANLMAVGASKCFTGRSKVLAFQGAYHGGAISFVGGASRMNVPHEFVLCPYNDAEAAKALFQAHGREIAAVLVEPMLGSGGCIAGEEPFLQLLREEATRHGSMLIFDEVMTSRLAGGGRQQTLRIAPDLTTLGKYIGGGSSIGAFGGRADLMNQFDPRRADALPHAGTFNNNVISMAAGIAGLTRVFTGSAADELTLRGETFRRQLNQICDDADAPLQFTGIGSLMNLQVTAEPLRRPAAVTAWQRQVKSLFFFHMVEHGLYLAPRGFIAMSLLIGEPQQARCREALQAFLRRYRASIPPQAREGRAP